MATTTQPTWGEVFAAPPGTTGEDLLRLPDDGYKYELYEGALVREMTSPGHGDICQRLGVELGIYARNAGFANRIVQNALFDLSVPGAVKRRVLAPDIAVLRGNAPPTWGVPHQAPLLAVKVVSEPQTLAELALKAQIYLSGGVEEVWVVDHQTRTIAVWTPQGTTTLNDTQTLASPLLPGFSVAVRFVLDG